MKDLQTLISRCRKVAEDATPGPWTNRMQDGVCNKYIDEGIVISFEERNNMRHEDIKFIVLSRATYLAALSVVEAIAAMRSEHWYIEAPGPHKLSVDDHLAAFAKAASDAVGEKCVEAQELVNQAKDYMTHADTCLLKDKRADGTGPCTCGLEQWFEKARTHRCGLSYRESFLRQRGRLARVTPELRKQILEGYRLGWSLRDIEKIVGVSFSTAGRVIRDSKAERKKP